MNINDFATPPSRFDDQINDIFHNKFLDDDYQNCPGNGCTDSNACNYDESTTFDDGTSYYSNGDWNLDDTINVFDIVDYVNYLLNCDINDSNYENDLCRVDLSDNSMLIDCAFYVNNNWTFVMPLPIDVRDMGFFNVYRPCNHVFSNISDNI